MEPTCETKLQAIESRHEAFLQEFQALNEELFSIFDEVTARTKNTYRNNSIVKDVNNRLLELERKRIELINTYHDEYATYEAIKAAETTHDYIITDLRKYSGKKVAPRVETSVANWNGRPRSQSFPGAFKNLFTRKRKGGKRNKQTRKL
jgi:hypothetical protein